jgi:hypothetical protein
VHEVFTQVDHVLEHKANPNKFERTEILHCSFTTVEKYLRNSQVLILSSTLLNKSWNREGITINTRKHFVLIKAKKK